jgi:hypothetical protein
VRGVSASVWNCEMTSTSLNDPSAEPTSRLRTAPVLRSAIAWPTCVFPRQGPERRGHEVVAGRAAALEDSVADGSPAALGDLPGEGSRLLRDGPVWRRGGALQGGDALGRRVVAQIALRAGGALVAELVLRDRGRDRVALVGREVLTGALVARHRMGAP